MQSKSTELTATVKDKGYPYRESEVKFSVPFSELIQFPVINVGKVQAPSKDSEN